MFKKLRKYCKWHQKQIKIGGEWKYETRLVAWYGVNIFGLCIIFTEIFNDFYVIFFHRYGPCDYVYSGLELKKNLNWAPELLDLLHRLIGMTRSDFNSCFANLYRHGKFCIIILTDNVQFFFCVFFNFTEIFSHRT